MIGHKTFIVPESKCRFDMVCDCRRRVKTGSVHEGSVQDLASIHDLLALKVFKPDELSPKE